MAVGVRPQPYRLDPPKEVSPEMATVVSNADEMFQQVFEDLFLVDQALDSVGGTDLPDPVTVPHGGTGLITVAQGDILYGSAADTLARLAKDANATRYLSNTGSSNNPAWAQVNLANGVTGNLPVGNLNSGTSASSSTFWRGDGTWATPASAGWALAASNSPSGVATVNFTGLAGYTDLRVVVSGMTFSVSSRPQLRVSVDNGSNYLSSSGDYIGVQGNGQSTSPTELNFYDTAATGARYGEIFLEGINITGAPKAARSNFFNTDGVHLSLIPNTNDIDAIRVFATQNFTGGTIYVFGR